jgi:hypothetical protein
MGCYFKELCFLVVCLTLAALATGPLGLAVAQPSAVQPGEVVPRDVRQIYDRGLQFLADSQSRDGTWGGGEPGPAMTQGLENAAQADGSWASGGKQGAGVTALVLLAFLASGEDANFGIYPRPPAQGGAAARRQHPGPVQPGDLHVAVAALDGAELSLPSHLRTMRGCPQECTYQCAIH